MSRRKSRSQGTSAQRRRSKSSRSKSLGQTLFGGPSRKGRARPLAFAAALLVVGLALSAVSLFFWSVTARPERHDADWLVFDASADPEQTVRSLYHQRLIDHPGLFRLSWAVFSPFCRLRPGKHVLAYGLTGRELVQRLCARPSRPRVKVTIVEGANRWQVADRLHAAGVVARESFLQAISDPPLLADLGIGGDSAEGYLFPATYPFPVDSEPENVVRTLVSEAKRRMTRLVQEHPPSQAAALLSEQDRWILASVVEKETAIAAERPRIARVFFNRLMHPEAETKGRLQSDPTAVYGCRLLGNELASCAHFDGKATPQMLADGQNPYNTYRRSGLPPGPIGNPGAEALAAVLHPAETDEFFFVADGEGGHRFSHTFEEHRAAVEALRKKRKGL